MDARLISQPWADAYNLEDFLAEVVKLPEPRRLRVAVAWAKRSGISRAMGYLRELRARGATAEVILGVSEGGATVQGLELALEVFDKAYVFHDPTGRTFHPKLYSVEYAEGRLLTIGSNNLTAGGLYYNYEAGVQLRLDPADALTAECDAWWDRLLAEDQLVRPLDQVLLARLVSQPDLRIQDEDRSRVTGDGDQSPETDLVSEDLGSDELPIFGRSRTSKKGPRASVSAQRATATRPPSPRSEQSPAIEPVASVVIHWQKRLKNSDAQQKTNPRTQLTGNLRLAAAGQPIDKVTFFRQQMFGDLEWRPDPDKADLEFALVPMQVTVYGRPLGAMTFRVDHQLSRISNQNNVPTVLKWGEMNAYMRAANHVGDYVSLDRFEDGSFGLSITVDPPL